MTRSPAEALKSWVPPSAKLRSISSRWNGSKNSPENECGLPRRSQDAQCNAFIALKKPSASATLVASAQTQRAEPFEIPKGAPELLARIGAEHRVELAAAIRQLAEIDGIGGKGCFVTSEPAPAPALVSGRRRSEPLTWSSSASRGDRRTSRSAHPRRRLPLRRRKDPIVLDRQRIEARITRSR